MSFKTEQESFWAGSFGAEYLDRNSSDGLIATNLAFFLRALKCAVDLKSCLEFGANVGMNLRALKLLYPKVDFHAIEINPIASKLLESVIRSENILQQSLLDFSPTRAWDLVLIKGVLIHINPEFLPIAYDRLFQSTKRYILICEYYNPTPVSIDYRGHADRLFKRDFAGEMLDRFSELRLVDYGFCYRRDPQFPQDDITWFLLEKRI
jgi:pseudaminic acid biosynthesis-associated methylase